MAETLAVIRRVEDEAQKRSEMNHRSALQSTMDIKMLLEVTETKLATKLEQSSQASKSLVVDVAQSAEARRKQLEEVVRLEIQVRRMGRKDRRVVRRGCEGKQKKNNRSEEKRREEKRREEKRREDMDIRGILSRVVHIVDIIPIGYRSRFSTRLPNPSSSEPSSIPEPEP